MAERTYSKGKKSVSDSLTESIKSVRYEDINGVNRLFGGRLMEWIDETAGIAARRHCGGDVTTSSPSSIRPSSTTWWSLSQR